MHLHENTAQISKSVCPNSWLFTAFPWNLGNALTLSSAIPPWAHLILSETASHLCSNASFSFLLEPLTNLQSSITVSYTLDAYLGTTPCWQKWKEKKKKQTHIFRNSALFTLSEEAAFQVSISDKSTATATTLTGDIGPHCPQHRPLWREAEVQEIRQSESVPLYLQSAARGFSTCLPWCRTCIPMKAPKPDAWQMS